MRRRPVSLAALLLWAGVPSAAHRLDEYLQAATISIEKDRMEAQLRLTPGVAVVPVVLSSIDTNGDGVLSAAEQRAYGARVVRDLSLSLDGAVVQPRLVSIQYPSVVEMQEGRGEIQMQLSAELPRGSASRRLTFENHHASAMSAYLVNCLVPRDPDIQVTAQNRDYQQSFYAVNYTQRGTQFQVLSAAAWPAGRVWQGAAALLLLLARFAMSRRQRSPLNTP